MAAPITQEVRSKILASIKDGMPIIQAAETHGVKAKTVSKWIRQATNNSHTSSSELQRTKKEIEFLRSVIVDLYLEQKASNRKGSGS